MAQFTNFFTDNQAARVNCFLWAPSKALLVGTIVKFQSNVNFTEMSEPPQPQEEDEDAAAPPGGAPSLGSTAEESTSGASVKTQIDAPAAGTYDVYTVVTNK